MAATTEAPERRGTLQELRDAALEFVNVLRARDNAPIAAELVPGERFSCVDCPLALTASATCADGGSWMVGPAHAWRLGPLGGDKRNVKPIPTPPLVAEFIRAFEAGAFPELIAA